MYKLTNLVTNEVFLDGVVDEIGEDVNVVVVDGVVVVVVFVVFSLLTRGKEWSVLMALGIFVVTVKIFLSSLVSSWNPLSSVIMLSSSEDSDVVDDALFFFSSSSSFPSPSSYSSSFSSLL